MRRLKNMTIALLAVLGASAMNAPASASDPGRLAGFMFDGLISGTHMTLRMA
jgi:hypothetical protein